MITSRNTKPSTMVKPANKTKIPKKGKEP
uniref:Uncharacterized protein n=1 Tax=Arundo donax TaxID=35708 RepID=A0A0A9EK25_ARUDO